MSSHGPDIKYSMTLA